MGIWVYDIIKIKIFLYKGIGSKSKKVTDILFN